MSLDCAYKHEGSIELPGFNSKIQMTRIHAVRLTYDYLGFGALARLNAWIH